MVLEWEIALLNLTFLENPPISQSHLPTQDSMYYNILVFLGQLTHHDTEINSKYLFNSVESPLRTRYAE